MDFRHNFGGRGRGGPFGGAGGFMGRFAGFGGGDRGGFRTARMIGSDDLQLIILDLLKIKPRHGYEIIKEVEERSSGAYIPSPGVIYPALTYLDEMGFATSEAEGNKKLYSITEAGTAQLEKNRARVDETLEHLSRFGRKMSQMQQHLAEEEAENEVYDADSRGAARGDWRRQRSEFRDIRDELRAALREKMAASFEEKTRVLEILKTAIREIRKK